MRQGIFLPESAVSSRPCGKGFFLPESAVSSRPCGKVFFSQSQLSIPGATRDFSPGVSCQFPAVWQGFFLPESAFSSRCGKVFFSLPESTFSADSLSLPVQHASTSYTQAAIPLFGQTKILHTLIGIDSSSLLFIQMKYNTNLKKKRNKQTLSGSSIFKLGIANLWLLAFLGQIRPLTICHRISRLTFASKIAFARNAPVQRGPGRTLRG